MRTQYTGRGCVGVGIDTDGITLYGRDLSRLNDAHRSIGRSCTNGIGGEHIGRGTRRCRTIDHHIHRHRISSSIICIGKFTGRIGQEVGILYTGSNGRGLN